MKISNGKRNLGKSIGFTILVLLLFGILLASMVLIRARWYAYMGLGFAVLTLVLVRTRYLWRGWRVLLCWACALAVAFTSLVLGRPDLQVSFTGTLQREGRRAAFHWLGQKGDYYAGAARVVENEKPWTSPQGITHTITQLTNSTLEFVEVDSSNGKIIYQLHGGAYLIPLANSYRDMAVQLTEISGGASVALLDYRVAPDAVFPAALEDALEGWEYLLSLGYKPNDILMVGDSAGGNLALALCETLRDNGQAMPCGIIAISPWADLAEEGASYQYNLYNDPSFGIAQGEDPANAGVPTTYAGDTDLRNPYLSPVFGSYQGFPPLLLTVGGWELLESDSLTIYEKAQAAGVDAHLINAHGMFHVYPVMAQSTPEGKAAWDAFESFMAAHLNS